MDEAGGVDLITLAPGIPGLTEDPAQAIGAGESTPDPGRFSGRKWIRLPNEEMATHGDPMMYLIQSRSWHDLARIMGLEACSDLQFPRT